MYDTGRRANFNADFQTDGFVRTDPLWVEPMDVEYLRSRYMGEISFMDRYLGWMLDALEKRGLARRTLVVLVSDHGEEFWDHRSLGHGDSVYEELLHVPLVMALPGVLPAARRPQVDAELVDLAPTLLDLLGMKAPPEMQGRSLLPWIAAPEAERPPHVSVGHSIGPEHHALRLGDWKLVRENPTDGVRDLPQFSLYDLRRDPGEILDTWPGNLVVGNTLRQLLEEHLERTSGAIPERVEGIERAKMDQELMETLRSLGYVE
jgi:arylsulfatase A-like enzyme